MSHWGVGVGPAMIRARYIVRGRCDLGRMCNKFYKSLKIKEIQDFEHIGVPICTDLSSIRCVWELCAGYRCGPR